MDTAKLHSTKGIPVHTLTNSVWVPRTPHPHQGWVLRIFAERQTYYRTALIRNSQWGWASPRSGRLCFFCELPVCIPYSACCWALCLPYWLVIVLHTEYWPFDHSLASWLNFYFAHDVLWQAKSFDFYMTRLILYGCEFHVLLRYFILQSSKNIFLCSLLVCLW